MFSEPLAKIKNETKIKTSLRARGPPGVSGGLRSVRILRIGRIGSAVKPPQMSLKESIEPRTKRSCVTADLLITRPEPHQCLLTQRLQHLQLFRSFCCHRSPVSISCTSPPSHQSAACLFASLIMLVCHLHSSPPLLLLHPPLCYDWQAYRCNSHCHTHTVRHTQKRTLP